jgi:hypothetical protein
MTQITIIALETIRQRMSLTLLTLECLNFWDFRVEVELEVEVRTFSAFWGLCLGL